MRAILKSVAVAMALTLGVGACSTIEDLDLGLSDEEPAVAERRVGPPKVPLEKIDSLELGRLYRGYMLIAKGTAPALGYYAPELRPRYEGQLAPDGFYEFDFVAVAPKEPIPGPSDAELRQLRGDFQLTPEMLRNARGVRVYGANDSVEGRF
jgi:hypothetical protein